MGTAVIAIVAFAIVLAVSFTTMGGLAGISEATADALRSSWREAERIVDSNVRPTSASASVTALIADVDIVIANAGRLKYTAQDFPEWNVIIRYQDTLGVERIEYIEYSDTLSPGSWTVDAIYADESTSTAEIYEPGIFNPSEDMVLTARLIRILGAGTLNQVTVSPPEGLGGSVHFDG